MTGVGAIIELFQFFNDGKKKEEEAPPVILEPEDESVLGFRDWESEWHISIQDNDWDELQLLLKEYDYKLYKPKEPDRKANKRRLRIVKAADYVGTSIKSCLIKKGAPEEEPKSPLLGMNGLGQTPLHLALRSFTPDKLAIRLVFAEKRAAAVSDDMGQLPLHVAANWGRSNQVMDRLCRAYRTGIQQEDKDGKTALWYVVHQATTHSGATDKSKSYWGIPRTPEESEWQRKQEDVWSKVRFMLLTYSTRKRILIESERDILLMALEHAAPPNVVEVVLCASQKELRSDPTLASDALALFMKRQYPIKNLQLLLHHFPIKNVQSMEAARKLLTKHYFQGCKTEQGRKMAFRAEMEKLALTRHGDKPYKPTLVCQEWWDKIKCLLRLCGHGNHSDEKKNFHKEHLLHAALSNCDTPPSLIQLLMVLRPEAIKIPHPANESLLIHLCCRNWKYNLFPISQGLGVDRDLELEEPDMEQVLRLILAVDPTVVRKPHRDRLPIHYAIATSKSLDFIQSILKHDTSLLAVRDPSTKLFPFQLAALINPFKNPAMWAAARRTPEQWNKEMTPEQHSQAVSDVIAEQDLDQLTSIFELLRAFPVAVSTATVLRKPAIFRDANGRGMISAHYTLWCYTQVEERLDGDKSWEPHPERMELFKDAIALREIPPSMEAWWGKLKFWIWYCYPKQLGDIPQEDKYLLHAAVANEDTPPRIIELVAAQFPESASLPVRGLDYPLHIAAKTLSYQPQPFEEDDMSTLEIVAKAYPKAATIRSAQGLPIHIAMECDKSWEEIEPLVQAVQGRERDKMTSRKVDKFHTSLNNLQTELEERRHLATNGRRGLDGIDAKIKELRGIVKATSSYFTTSRDIDDEVQVDTSDDSMMTGLVGMGFNTSTDTTTDVSALDSSMDQSTAERKTMNEDEEEEEEDLKLKKFSTKKLMKGTF
jgi:hypothetical protein